MWVLIKKSYAGLLCGQAFFAPGGQKKDLTESQIIELRKKLGKEDVLDTCAPWDEHKDHKAVKAAEVKQKALAAIAKVEQMQKRMAELREVAREINVLKKELDDAVPKAKGFAKAAGIEWSAPTSRGEISTPRGGPPTTRNS